MKILRTEKYNDLVAKLAMYREVLKVEQLINKKLESKMDKMKCCANCRNGAFDEGSFFCDGTVPIKKRYFDKCDSWECKE